jgi:hypothetical protein
MEISRVNSILPDKYQMGLVPTQRFYENEK